jgi:hypothetical protein
MRYHNRGVRDRASSSELICHCRFTSTSIPAVTATSTSVPCRYWDWMDQANGSWDNLAGTLGKMRLLSLDLGSIL